MTRRRDHAVFDCGLSAAAGAGGQNKTVVDKPSSAPEVGALIHVSGAAHNLGDGTISEGIVIDTDNPNLLRPVIIKFTTPHTCSIDGTDIRTYSSGKPIAHNGWQVVITGSPCMGDAFMVEPTPMVGRGK